MSLPKKIGNIYLELRHIIAGFILFIIGLFIWRFSNSAALLIYTILALIVLLYQPGCPKDRKCKGEFLDKNGFGIIYNFLSPSEFKKYQTKFVKDYDNNTIFLGNPNTWGYKDKETQELIENIQRKIEKGMNKKLNINYCFIRYYEEGSFNPFEAFHLDSLHYNLNVEQIRALINLSDQSDGYFSYNSKCCEKKNIKFKTKENSLVLIQANKLLHKYEYIRGKRCVLVIDFIDSKKKGPYGYFWGTWDYCWDRIQKRLTTKKKKKKNNIS